MKKLIVLLACVLVVLGQDEEFNFSGDGDSVLSGVSGSGTINTGNGDPDQNGGNSVEYDDENEGEEFNFSGDGDSVLSGVSGSGTINTGNGDPDDRYDDEMDYPDNYNYDEDDDFYSNAEEMDDEDNFMNAGAYDETQDLSSYYNWGYDVQDEKYYSMSKGGKYSTFNYKDELNEQNQYRLDKNMKQKKKLLVSPLFRITKTLTGYVGKQLEYPSEKAKGNGGFKFTDDLNDYVVNEVQFNFDGSVAPLMTVSETKSGPIIKTLENGLSRNFVNWAPRKGVAKEKIDTNQFIARSSQNQTQIQLDNEGRLVEIQYVRVSLNNWKRKIISKSNQGVHSIVKDGCIAKRGHMRKVRKNLPNLEFKPYPAMKGIEPYTVFGTKVEENLGYFKRRQSPSDIKEAMYYDENGKAIIRFTNLDDYEKFSI